MKETIGKVNKTKSWFFEEINKIDKTLASLIKKERNHKDLSRNNEKEIKEIIVKVNKTKSWFFEKTNKIDKRLARLIKKKKERRLKSTK